MRNIRQDYVRSFICVLSYTICSMLLIPLVESLGSSLPVYIFKGIFVVIEQITDFVLISGCCCFLPQVFALHSPWIPGWCCWWLEHLFLCKTFLSNCIKWQSTIIINSEINLKYCIAPLNHRCPGMVLMWSWSPMKKENQWQVITSKLHLEHLNDCISFCNYKIIIHL